MTANEWRKWFITERLHLHDVLVERLVECADFNQKAEELCEHDGALHRLAKHAQKRIKRADMVSLFACREIRLSDTLD